MKTNLKHLLVVSGMACFALVACKEEAKKDTAMEDERTPAIVMEN